MTPEESRSSARDEVFRLSDEVVDAVAELRPVTATLWGVPGHDAEWDDLSPEGHEQARARLAGFVGRLPPPPPATDHFAALAAEVLADFLRLELDRYDHGDPLADLNNMTSPFQLLRLVFDVMDGASVEGWRARVRRLQTLPVALEGYRRSLDRGLREGRAVAARQVRAAIEQGHVHAGERSAFRTLPGAMEQAGVLDPSLRSQLADAVPLACEAYASFGAWLQDSYLPRARSADGVGRERYVREARRFLGMELDPDRTYEWGWREVAAIGEQMRALAGEISPGRSVAEVLQLLATDPARRAPDVEAFLELMRGRQRLALERLSGTHFDVPEPVRALDVKLAPPGGPLGAYYIPPSEDFARPGCVWYAPGDGRTYPLFDQVAIAYHEGFPGHHLQIGTQVALTGRLSRLHRVADGYTGYAEGWALYAEQLMAELGAYEQPEYLLGMLSAQMVRACRVVIDLGCHLSLPIPADQPFHPGGTWSFETGVEMLTTLGGLRADHAASELTRYLGWPGQAISYKVGQRVILELRDEERGRLGASFDPRDFHRRVLESGNVGLDHLRRLVPGGAPTPGG